ncbi:MAG: VIT domain-containing protein [Gemmatimonadaceae bacterium]
MTRRRTARFALRPCLLAVAVAACANKVDQAAPAPERDGGARVDAQHAATSDSASASPARGATSAPANVPASQPTSRPSVSRTANAGYADATAREMSAATMSADELLVIAEPGSARTEKLARTPTFAAPRGAAQSRVMAGVLGGTDEARPTAAPAEPRATQGTLRARNVKGETVGEFPLRHTDVQAEISGPVARTVVEQRYANPFDEAIEAVYIFPLPGMAAVNDFVMEVGGRKIVGVVRPRDEAERIYRDARARGQTASLLTQERPNIFTQSVANIEAKGSVTIRITYFERLPYEHGEYAYMFPMVVGPRYVSRQVATTAGLGTRDSALGSARRVGLAIRSTTPRPGPESRIPSPENNPPVLRPGQRSGHDIALTVRLNAGLPITRLATPTHRVVVDSAAPSRRVLRLADGDSIPNRDFVLRWRAAGTETQFGVLAHRSGDAGFFSLSMQPPLAPRDAQVTPREVTFIMDVSGSMTGVPLDISKGLITRTLDRLRDGDRFNIVYFSGGNAQLWERAREGTPANVAEAKRFLASVSAGGGTEMIAGLRRAMTAHHDPEFLQMYVFLTDGYVGEDQEILGILKHERGDARFFGFGIGSSVNRYLIDGIGEHGGGMSQIILPRDSAGAAESVGRLFDAIDSPVLVDVAIDWNGLPVREVYPGRPRDLFAGQVIDVIGRYDRPARGTAYVTGRVGTRRVRYPVTVDLPAERADHAALAPTWARGKIADLSGDLLTASEGARAEIEREITDLAVRHHLVSQYTAFVAVDESRVVGDGRPLRIMQPVELPEGVSYEGIFGREGERPVGVPASIGAWGVTVQETDKGAVRVGAVREGSAAARAGVRAGAAITGVNGSAVRGMPGLGRLLMQTGSTGARVRLEPGGEVVLPVP